MSIHVQLERFEGPLGLLLHLIREQEMDIFNINIHEITRQYLEYIKAMRRLDLEVAGEFVAMAATLLHIKSRMLLPQYNEEGEEVEADPRKELVQKLVEYKRIRELSVDLYKRPLLGRDVFTRGERENIEAIEESELVLEENPLFSLISAYRTAVKNMKKTVHRVASELQSIASRIMEIKDMLVMGRRVLFRDLITAKENVSSQVLVTFLSMLELAKMGFVSVFQTEPFADIHIESKQSIDQAAVSRVESYDSVNAAATAEAIMHTAQLTLDEPADLLEGEAEPVVVEGFADAASDADIEAEERRLFEGETKEALPNIDFEPSSHAHAEHADVGEESPVTVEMVENVEAAIGEADLSNIHAHADHNELEVVELETSSVEIAPVEVVPVEAVSIETPPVEVAPLEVVPIEAASVEVTPLETLELPPTSSPVEAVVPAEVTPPVISRPTIADDLAFLTAPEPGDVVKENINSAVNAAKSAFDAFNDDPEVK